MRHNLTRIERYTDPATMIDEQCPNAPGWKDLPEDARDTVAGALDYEGLILYVVNNDTVLTVDAVNGEVLGDDELADYVQQTIAWARGLEEADV